MLTARSLSDARVGTSKRELVAQQAYSRRIIRRLAGSWQVAPRHATCWSHVAWASTCDRARRRLLAHRWLYRLATTRLERLYETVAVSVPEIIRQVFGANAGEALAVAECESRFSPYATNGQYFGIFQMGSAERARFGGSTTDPWDQVRAAYRYFAIAGWGPWQCA